MAKGIYIGTEKIITVTNLLDYNTLSNNDGGYWGKWNLSGQTDYVNWGSGSYPPGGQRCGRFNKNITSGLAEATYQLTVQSGSIKINLNSSHLYYFSIYLYQPLIIGSFACYWPIAEPPAVSNFTVSQINTWERHSAIFNRNSFSNGNYDIRFDFDNPTSNSTLYFGNVALVDLTATFGAGFEPDKEWCDENINFLDSSSTLASETATITVNYSVASKVKKMYIGINDIARKVKKGYIGVGGVARPFFSGGELTYMGQYDGYEQSYAAGATVGEKALFAYGRDSDGSKIGTIMAYSKDFVLTTIPTSNSGNLCAMGASTADYAVFAGGLSRTTGTPSAYSSTRAINASLTENSLTNLSSARGGGCGTSFNGYAVIGGGRVSTGGSGGANVDTYDNSLTLSSPAQMGSTRYGYAAACVGDYMLFAGGCSAPTTASAIVNAFDKSFTRTSPTSLSQPRANLAGASADGKYAIFWAGSDRWLNASDKYNTVDAYDTSLTRVLTSNIGTATYSAIGGSIGEYALFGAGSVSQTFVYDASLTHKDIDPISETFRTAVTVDEFLFICGRQGLDKLDVYAII